MQRARKRVGGVPSENAHKGTLHESSIAIAWIELAGLSCASSVLLHLQTDAQLPVVQGDWCTAAAAFVLIMPRGKEWEMLLFSFSLSLLRLSGAFLELYFPFQGCP